jgi:N-acetylated-alpha-linked acidic dipeptidase
MRRTMVLLIAGLLLASGAGAARADNGYPTDRQVERFLIDIPTSQGAADDSARLNEEMHYPGTIGDHDMALWMRDKLESFGFSAHIEPVFTQVPQFKHAVLQLMVSPRVDFDLQEGPLTHDWDGARHDAGTPFNAWSGSGDVTAQLVYAGHGLDADYQTLANANVSVQGRIVLVRYGSEFRGLLARRAEKNGAAGVIFYTDPADRDGSANGAPYPDGPYRPNTSVQRGSLGAPALSIPVLPITAFNAGQLLRNIAGVPSPQAWHGGLDSDYLLGATRVPVRLRVDISNPWITIWNTVGVLPGLDTSHQVILGGHRDAWVYGVTDNGSGISTLLEAAHALGYIYKAGWRPHYSILIGGWDGEEIGEAGSDSFVRTHEAILRRGCVAYVNADEDVAGTYFYASGVAGLADITPRVARLVPDPHVKTHTLWETWGSENGGIQTRAPGGGSDHEPFLYLLGVPTLSFGFAGPFGVYHSVFDDLRYATTEADPGFNAHRTMAQMLALTAYRLTMGPMPYRLSAYTQDMQGTLNQIGRTTALAPDLAPVSLAIERFGERATAYERGGVDPTVEIEAVHRLNMLFYGRNGYQALAFPALSGAIATGDAGRIQTEAGNTAASIDAVTALLR